MFTKSTYGLYTCFIKIRKLCESMATTVFRVEKNREFVVMNNKFLREKDMSLKAKGLLATFLSLPEDWEYSINGLCAILKESQTSIRSALKELETFHYLKRNRQKDEKGQFVYEYIIYETPYSGFVHTDNQHAVNAHAENDRLQSINKQSIKKQNIDIKESKKESKGKQKESYETIINQQVNNQELKDLYWEYIRMRQMIKAPLSNRALKMLITRAERLSNFDVNIQIKMLENAIMNNWKSLYLPNVEAEKNQQLQALRNFYTN